MTDLLWLIPVIPAASAFILVVLGARLPRRWLSLQSCFAVFASFGFALAALAALLRLPEGSAGLTETLLPWISSGRFAAPLSFTFDPLSGVMAVVVSGVSFLIHVYSVGYMAKDESLARYFAHLNLFTSFMLILVLASNIVLMFVGWEGVGLCSYLLIGFWFGKPAAADAGMKAFLINRIGDAAFLIGILFLLLNVGSAEFSDIRTAVAGGDLSPGLITLVALLLFIGATGKSAQIPLYVWLPDAMEGPTPVSALIHAATMVTAGVYMVARLSPLYGASETASSLVALVGAVTAVFAATMALVQNDIKRVLAYSTISQIGYMFIGCGVGAYAAGIFHLATHAFFKSLLFLAAGSVIHALTGEQDLRRMGGLRTHLPRTFPVFLVGAVAISGVPFLSGFFSKDAILASAFSGGRYAVWGLGLLGAVMTAFYMFRLVYLAFYGKERFPVESGRPLHESPPVMTVPLAVLAGFSIFAGYLALPAVFGEKANVFGLFLETVLPVPRGHLSAGMEWALMGLSTAAAFAGVALARHLYLRKPSIPAALTGRFPGLHRLLVRKYYVDEIYGAVFVRPAIRISELVYGGFDLKVIDGTLNGTAAATNLAGKALAFLQSGFVKDYALALLLGVTLFLGYLLLS
jgi:NADH-quinone oxidoreductase subunit L